MECHHLWTQAIHLRPKQGHLGVDLRRSHLLLRGELLQLLLPGSLHQPPERCQSRQWNHHAVPESALLPISATPRVLEGPGRLRLCPVHQLPAWTLRGIPTPSRLRRNHPPLLPRLPLLSLQLQGVATGNLLQTRGRRVTDPGARWLGRLVGGAPSRHGVSAGLLLLDRANTTARTRAKGSEPGSSKGGTVGVDARVVGCHLRC